QLRAPRDRHPRGLLSDRVRRLERGPYPPHVPSHIKFQHGSHPTSTMYAVVGCGECSALWVVEDRPETTTCPSCGKRHTFDALKKFAEHEAGDAAREARTRLLAARSDHAPDELDSFGELESRAEQGRMTDDEYLEKSGLD